MTDVARRLTAALADRYRIERELGQGGMATVYLADDLKHDRKVAIKVLKPDLAAVVGAERFLAEIRTTANLQHPHILPLFDSGEADGFLFYVMPHVEGESLREKLDRETQLRVDDALALTRKVGDALDYAHGKGVVHRDIKPANILLSERGEPLVADFGIALAVSQAGGGRLTETGLSLGTPHYMSPEQATGDRDVDPRSDVYALACVLYELLAGQPPFAAPTAQGVLAKILTESPRPVTELRRTAAPNVAAALARALEKLPADRFEGARDFLDALDDPHFTHEVSAAFPASGAGTRQLGAGAAGGSRRAPRAAGLLWALGGAAVVAAGFLLSRPAPDPPARVVRTDLDLGSLLLPDDERIVVSPDGSAFAMAAESPTGQQVLWVRRSDEADWRMLPQTEGARRPVFSPQGDWIAYGVLQDRGLYKIALAGGAPQTIALDVNPASPHWGDGGTIVFTGPGGLRRVSEAGGTPEPIAGGRVVGTPRFLPGERALLAEGNEVLEVIDLETDSVIPLGLEGVDARYLPTGHLVYVHPRGGLQVVPFDLERLEVTGQPVPVQDGVGYREASPTFAYYSASDEGTLVYTTARGGGDQTAQQLIQYDLETGALDTIPLSPRSFESVAVSPDGRRVAFQDADIPYVYELELASSPRALSPEPIGRGPVWSPDGTRLAFSRQDDVEGGFDIFVKNVFDDTPATIVIDRSGFLIPTDWPADDQLIFSYPTTATQAGFDIEAGDPSGVSESRIVVSEEGSLDRGTVSPDGRFIAYQSARAQGIFVRSYPDARQPTRINEARSPARGPVWSADGRGVYYWKRGQPDTLMLARVETDPVFQVVAHERVVWGDYEFDDWDVHPDGKSIFLVTSAAGAVAGSPIERHIVVVNWFEELQARLGGG